MEMTLTLVARRLACSNAAQYDQAIYCYNKAIRVNKADVDAITRRSSLYEKTGQYRKVRTIRYLIDVKELNHRHNNLPPN